MLCLPNPEHKHRNDKGREKKKTVLLFVCCYYILQVVGLKSLLFIDLNGLSTQDLTKDKLQRDENPYRV